jgi:hypothetical protein
MLVAQVSPSFHLTICAGYLVQKKKKKFNEHINEVLILQELLVISAFNRSHLSRLSIRSESKS